jgi:hypothetical protein
VPSGSSLGITLDFGTTLGGSWCCRWVASGALGLLGAPRGLLGKGCRWGPPRALLACIASASVETDKKLGGAKTI